MGALSMSHILTCSPFFSWMWTNDLKDCCARASVYVPCNDTKTHPEQWRGQMELDILTLKYSIQ